MKKIIFLLLIAISVHSTLYSQRQVMMERMWQHAYTLSADSMQGRKTGTVYAAKAADYICTQLKGMGAWPYADTSYFFPISYTKGIGKGKNVMAVIPGTDPQLKDEYIVIGAHYDHLGTRSGNGDTIYNGADDNASGVSVLLEVARALINHPEKLKRSVLIAFFDAEEIGLWGSTYLANHFICPIEKVKLMMSIDMVGYLQTSGFLKYIGNGTIMNGKDFIRSLPWESPYGKIELKKFESSVFTATDTRPFAKLGCPTLAVTTGLKSPYHLVSDEASGLDFMGMTYVADHLTALIVKAATDESFKSSGRVAYIHDADASQYQYKFAFSLMMRTGYNHLALDKQKSELVGRRKGMLDLDAELHFRTVKNYELGLGVGYQKIASGYMPEDAYKAHALFSQLRLQSKPLIMNDMLEFSVFIAPYYRYVFSGSQQSLNTQKQETAWQDLLSMHHFGLSTGLNYRFGHFLLEYRYYFDFTPMLKDAFVPNGRNRSYTVGLGYMF